MHPHTENHAPMRRIMIPAAIVVAAISAAPGNIQAQSSNAEQEAIEVVKKTFDAMRTRDTATIRSLFDTAARLVTTASRDGQPVVRSTKMSDFIKRVASAPPTDTLIETIYDTEVRVDGNLATVWTGYDFHVNSRFSHCGVDAFQLVRTNEGWKIVAIADTQRREGCKNAK